HDGGPRIHVRKVPTRVHDPHEQRDNDRVAHNEELALLVLTRGAHVRDRGHRVARVALGDALLLLDGDLAARPRSHGVLKLQELGVLRHARVVLSHGRARRAVEAVVVRVHGFVHVLVLFFVLFIHVLLLLVVVVVLVAAHDLNVVDVVK
uniref:Uncharacterized protein n=1 Tax=Globisporangium ultimum (strain ATCC 200006 / CBS 805.95 / DAOM BR144) TaxID=431595 RepID=K3WQN5_GLOUD